MSGAKPARVKRLAKNKWLAVCRIKRCSFADEHLTHNGAHIAKARHNRRKHASAPAVARGGLQERSTTT